MTPLWPQRTLPNPRQFSFPLSRSGFCARILIKSNFPVATALSRSESRFVKELAIIEVSRHASSLYMSALKRKGRHLEFDNVGFRVDFAFSPPRLAILPFPFDNAHSTDSCQRVHISKERLPGSTFIEIKVPIGEYGNTETLTCLGEVKEPCGFIVQPPGQSKKAFGALCAGIRVGGFTRNSCRDDNLKKFDACYDEIDELIRRLRKESESFKRPLFDAELIAVVVDRYLVEVDDSKPARFS